MDNGGISLALRSIDDAAACGVDAVKFQYFTHKDLYGVDGENKYELPRKWLGYLSSHCELRGVDFLCSAFSAEGIGIVDPYVKMHKIASSEMQDYHLIRAAAATKKPVIISTGGHSTDDVAEAMWAFDNKEQFHFLECSLKYPAEVSDYALSKQWFDGISDHTTGAGLAILSIGHGAKIFEKHFDCLIGLYDSDSAEETPDTAVSVGPQFMSQYVQCIRDGFVASGGAKRASESNSQAALRWKRRLKITKQVRGGQDRLEYGVNFGSFRSVQDDAKAASPLEWEKFQGARVKRDMNPQDGLWFDDIE